MLHTDNNDILRISDFISLEDLGDQYIFYIIKGKGITLINPEGYNRHIQNLYNKTQGKDLKISLQKFEEIVITDYNDLVLNKSHSHSLKKEIENIPINNFHALLPIYHVQITTEKLEIGKYRIIRFQQLGQYIKSLKDVVSNYPLKEFTEDVYFYDIPFVDIVVDARDETFAIESAKNKLQSFVSFLNYCLFSDIKGIDVVSSYPDAGNRNRYYLVSPTSFSSSLSAKDPRTTRPNISELLKYITQGEGNNRLIEIVQEDIQKNEIEKRLFNALNWLGLSIAEKNNAVALTQATFAIECLLQSDVKGEPITKSIVSSISESLAFLLGDNFETRKELEKQFKTIYGLRSKVAHGKGDDITIKCVFESISLAKKTMIALLTNPELKNAKTIQMVNNYIEKKRYTCTEDKQ